LEVVSAAGRLYVIAGGERAWTFRAGSCCQRHLKVDHLAAGENGPPWSSWFLGGGRGDAAEVSVLEPVGVALEGDDVGVVDEPVDHGCGDDVVAEDLAPASEWLVAGDDEAGAFVAGGDELEEEVGGSGSKGM
jgi:hypothetical protein